MRVTCYRMISHKCNTGTATLLPKAQGSVWSKGRNHVEAKDDKWIQEQREKDLKLSGEGIEGPSKGS